MRKSRRNLLNLQADLSGYTGGLEKTMKRFEVDFTDNATGATSAIDTIEADDNYTAESYVRDCESNADAEYIEMLHNGTVTLIEID